LSGFTTPLTIFLLEGENLNIPIVDWFIDRTGMSFKKTVLGAPKFGAVFFVFITALFLFFTVNMDGTIFYGSLTRPLIVYSATDAILLAAAYALCAGMIFYSLILTRITIDLFAMAERQNWKSSVLKMSRNNTNITVDIREAINCPKCVKGVLLPKESERNDPSPFFYECPKCGNQVKGVNT